MSLRHIYLTGIFFVAAQGQRLPGGPGFKPTFPQIPSLLSLLFSEKLKKVKADGAGV